MIFFSPVICTKIRSGKAALKPHNLVRKSAHNPPFCRKPTLSGATLNYLSYKTKLERKVFGRVALKKKKKISYLQGINTIKTVHTAAMVPAVRGGPAQVGFMPYCNGHEIPFP